MASTYGKQVTWKGECHTISEWAKILGVNIETFRNHIYRNDYSDFKYYTGESMASRPVAYIKKKIYMLESQFYINLTPEERAHFHTLTTEVAVDQYAHDLILKKL